MCTNPYLLHARKLDCQSMKVVNREGVAFLCDATATGVNVRKLQDVTFLH